MENEISPWVMDELKRLRSENEKLRKVLDAAIALDREHIYIDTVKHPNHYSLHMALKEWKGENGQD